MGARIGGSVRLVLVVALLMLAAPHAWAGRFVTFSIDHEHGAFDVDELEPATGVTTPLFSESPAAGSGVLLAVSTSDAAGGVYYLDESGAGRRLARADLAGNRLQRVPLDMEGWILIGIDYDVGEGRLYALEQLTTGEPGTSRSYHGLVEVDPVTGIATPIGPRFPAMVHQDQTALDEARNRLWVVDSWPSADPPHHVRLIGVDTTTGDVVATLPLFPTAGSDACLAFAIRHITYDPIKRRLLAIVWPCSGQARLEAIDVATGAMTTLQTVASQTGTPCAADLDPCGRRFVARLKGGLFTFDADTGAVIDQSSPDEIKFVWLAWDRDAQPCFVVSEPRVPREQPPLGPRERRPRWPPSGGE